MPPCATLPTVNNARPSVVNGNDTVTVTFECLTGFYMSGDPVVVCLPSVGVWSPRPECNVINQDTNVTTTINNKNEEWLYYCLIGLLALIAVALLAATLAYCCCRPTHVTTVYPYTITRVPASWWRRCCCGSVDGSHVVTHHDSSNYPQQPRGRGSVLWVTGANGGPAPMTSVETPTQRVAHVTKHVQPAKDPNKHTKIWMPHTHIVRNTSTK
ncbi:uncharacterized protein LOC131941970 [Physella acuta]|uniref:uncharacterized protein LOC131941970 n=1 Tax=Physella acuta TaxID=109671 RepID=UPI0027DD2D5A|nr:uncharacterized protein LOC131941970 [Physella acuta]